MADRRCSFCGAWERLRANGLHPHTGGDPAICRNCASTALAALDPEYRARLEGKILSLDTHSFNTAPGYWMNETSGVLRPAIEAYLRGNDELTPEHLAAFRAYLRQWIAAPAWQGETVDLLRATIDAIRCRGDIAAWLHVAEQEGIDPL